MEHRDHIFYRLALVYSFHRLVLIMKLWRIWQEWWY